MRLCQEFSYSTTMILRSLVVLLLILKLLGAFSSLSQVSVRQVCVALKCYGCQLLFLLLLVFTWNCLGTYYFCNFHVSYTILTLFDSCNIFCSIHTLVHVQIPVVKGFRATDKIIIIIHVCLRKSSRTLTHIAMYKYLYHCVTRECVRQESLYWPRHASHWRRTM